ncbi:MULTISPECIES: hypothetical protein [unclassified Crossiella]|uniref:hypothetical protein n=1 Tax=unclassified Crossiella TaxID=2620835 RepID=UPI001FFF27A5|nr:MULTISPECIES: hypothetical protein [unclassified Crossiella]MCK2245406.1 hypothetical protein [Crossiella sp. S99.2]MCK2259058.1 hypothetical protein [Crossiella sp. S99.1]
MSEDALLARRSSNRAGAFRFSLHAVPAVLVVLDTALGLTGAEVRGHCPRMWNVEADVNQVRITVEGPVTRFRAGQSFEHTVVVELPFRGLQELRDKIVEVCAGSWTTGDAV